MAVVRSGFRALKPSLDAEAVRAEGHDLKKPTRDRQILQEVNHLILIGEIVMKAERCDNREDRETERNRADLELESGSGEEISRRQKG